MVAAGNVDGKWSEKKMEGDDGLRTTMECLRGRLLAERAASRVAKEDAEQMGNKKMEGDDGLRTTMECLRGRLLAERAASRVAKEDAEQMGNKLIELETQLRAEIKSRNKAEKKLKFLMKKLESMNISYVSDESERSSLLEKSEMSCVSSTASSSSKEPEDKESITQIKNFPKCDIEEPMQKTELLMIKNLKQNIFKTSTSTQHHIISPSNEETLSSRGTADSERSEELESRHNYNDSMTDNHGEKTSIEEKNINEENYQNEDGYVDNSLALVPLDLPKTADQILDPAILDSTVKEVLDALRHAKEKLQRSMDSRHMFTIASR
ncbi:unnamed protein product [Ilex paraguariensis]|uniref:Uncharacterized protein n=2 Tax=Ilex paraguariensis TaxID=185542 RepID=A0ABC8TD07_9AQUA